MDAVTKADLGAALAPLPTREDMRSAIDEAIAPLATREEVRSAIDTAVAPLATREEVRSAIDEAIAPLATREEMRAAIDTAVAPLATRDELSQTVREEAEQTRRHFDVVAESLRGDIRLLAEGQVTLQQRVDHLRKELKADIAKLDRRVMHLEVARG